MGASAGKSRRYATKVPGLMSDTRYRDLVREFAEEHEFGLAVEAICDFLSEPGNPRPTAELVKEIGELHEAMGVVDDCVGRLTAKIGP
jgi:hypothetical protein